MPVTLRAKLTAVRGWLGLGVALWLALLPLGACGQQTRRFIAESRLPEDRGAAQLGPRSPLMLPPVPIRPVTTSSGIGAVSPASRDALVALADRAGVIFAGHVLQITRNDAAGFVDVRFHIDQAIRGCPSTGAYVLREWAGLWTGKAPRYRAGQSLLLLLTARGPSGMSAPIGGAEMDGAIPLAAKQLPPLAHGTGVAPPERGLAGPAWSVDLRWVQAHAVRAVTHAPTTPRLHPLSVGQQARMTADFEAETPPEAMAAVQSVPTAALIAPLGAEANYLQEQPSLETVLLLLRDGGGAIHGTR